jgi:hypothetical protein
VIPVAGLHQLHGIIFAAACEAAWSMPYASAE